jgi:hypothetical protein
MNAKPTLAGLAACATLGLACNPDKGTLWPAVGAVQASAATTGADLDPDGYSVIVDSGAGLAVGINGSVTVSGLSSGAHIVALAGIATNCALSGANPRSVNVVAGDTAPLVFAVGCTAITTTGALQVTTVTTGDSLDPDGYLVTGDGISQQPIATNGTITITGLEPGTPSVLLTGIAGNCTLTGANPRVVEITAGATTLVTFQLTCARTRSVTVTVATTGVSLDRDGYVVSVYNAGGPIAVNGTVTFSGVVAGSRFVTLSGVAPNCRVAGAYSQPITVVAGDTTAVSFAVSCGPVTQLAFVSVRPGYIAGNIALMNSDGSGVVPVTSFGSAPAWSTDGTRIAFQDTPCCGSIYVVHADGTGLVRLTNTYTDDAPAWSPDGNKIAFQSFRSGATEIYVMHADGTGVTQLTSTPGGFSGHPAWSPDGSRIAFTSYRDGHWHIYVMNADGSGVVRLTSDQSDVNPAWSPDGNKIAFVRGAQIYVMNADGSSQTNLNAVSDPNEGGLSWSPDGAKIAFGVGACDDSGCYIDIYVVNVDGTNLDALTNDHTSLQPAWRPRIP